MKRLVIIDGKSVFYRGYYAMGNLSLRDGTPTGGIYGFAAIATEIVQQLMPNRIVVAWDSKTSTSQRKALYSEYKAGRTKPGEDFYAQIPLLKEMVLDFGWNFVECDDYEADDIIGTLAQQADQEIGADGRCEWETFIVSSDLDMLQIVDDNTRMYRILKGFTDLEELDVSAVEAKYGIKKAQFLDLKALKGDASDNIPGVPGIGEKSAAKLLNQYGNLDEVYNHIAEIKGSIKEKLIQGKDSAYLSRKLSKIMFDAPVRLDEMKDFEFNGEKIKQALDRLEFKSLIHKFGLNDINSTTSTAIEMSPDDLKAKMHEDAEFAKKIMSGETLADLASGTVLNDFDLPLVPVLFKMEQKGMMIDRLYFAKLAQELADQVKTLEQQIWQLAGREFNINSPVQLSEVLFEVLKLPTKGIKKTQRGYSTGAKELDKLQELHPIIKVIKEYRELAKLLSTYVIPLPDLADAEDRIHTTFTQNVTATGRLSSVNPNLQNIPVRTEAGKRIRTGFVAPDGKKLVSADYSQFELRLAAALAGDKKLVADFNAGIDIHTKTASEVFGVPMSEVTKMQRRAAKVVNFGVLYGMSAKGLADATGMSVPEARSFIEGYFELRAPIKSYLDQILRQAREKGFVETYFGRKRVTPDVKAANFLVRAAAERAAQNMPIQGTEADLMKRAMIRVDKRLPIGADLVMQVHDSLIVECEDEQVAVVKEILADTMEHIAPELAIKLDVDVTVGQNWGEL